MRAERRRQLEAAGFRVGDAADFLELDEQERLYLEIRRSLGRLLRSLRQRSGVSQVSFAAAIEVDQSTLSRVERADGRVSLGKIVSALIACGATREDIARAIRDSAN